MQTKLIPFSLCLLFLVACTSRSELVTSAVEQTVAAQTPVIQIIPQTVIAQVPVTVEVTRQVVEFKEVEVTRLVEITRVVERVLTATPTPTDEATQTPTPTATSTQLAATTSPPTPNITGQLLQSMLTTRTNMEAFGGLIDAALSTGSISCQAVVDLHDRVANAPVYNVGNSSATVSNAYNTYRAAIDTFTTGTRDMTQNCRDFLANPTSGTIPFQQWGLARQTVNNAVSILSPAIASLEG